MKYFWFLIFFSPPHYEMSLLIQHNKQQCRVRIPRKCSIYNINNEHIIIFRACKQKYAPLLQHYYTLNYIFTYPSRPITV